MGADPHLAESLAGEGGSEPGLGGGWVIEWDKHRLAKKVRSAIKAYTTQVDHHNDIVRRQDNFTQTAREIRETLSSSNLDEAIEKLDAIAKDLSFFRGRKVDSFAGFGFNLARLEVTNPKGRDVIALLRKRLEKEYDQQWWKKPIGIAVHGSLNSSDRAGGVAGAAIGLIGGGIAAAFMLGGGWMIPATVAAVATVAGGIGGYLAGPNVRDAVERRVGAEKINSWNQKFQRWAKGPQKGEYLRLERNISAAEGAIQKWLGGVRALTLAGDLVYPVPQESGKAGFKKAPKSFQHYGLSENTALPMPVMEKRRTAKGATVKQVTTESDQLRDLTMERVDAFVGHREHSQFPHNVEVAKISMDKAKAEAETWVRKRDGYVRPVASLRPKIAMPTVAA